MNSRPRLREGLIQVFTGNGKGKTTSALGLALRAMGHGFKTYMIQFMKGNITYGELKAAEKLDPYITIFQFGRETFVSKEDPDPEDVQLAQEGLEHARNIITSDKYDIVILDEINVALDFNLISLQQVKDLINSKPPKLELILTGRYAPPEIVALADLVTEMQEIKYWDFKKLGPRQGIER